MKGDWSDGAVVVVRGAPMLWGHSHDQTVVAMREDGCFYKSLLFRCQPIAGGRMVFDWKHTFGALEILVVSASELSEDFQEWSSKAHAEFPRLDEIPETWPRATFP